MFNPEQIQTFMSNARGKIFNNVGVGDNFKKRSQWNKAYELVLDNFIICQKQWIKALKKSSSFREKALKVRQNKEEIANLQKGVEIKDAQVLGMQVEQIDPNCTKFAKEESKQACHESLNRTEKDLLKVEDKDEITFLMKGLKKILKIQDIFMGLLKEELNEKTNRVDMFRTCFDNNLNRLMSSTNENT